MKGIVYKIEFGEWLYIGSTTQTLNGRQLRHNYDYKIRNINYKLYEKARENNIENIKCILLKQVDFDDIIDLRREEEKYRIILKANLNKYACIKNEKNKDKLSEKFKCECGGKYTLSYKSTHLKTNKHMNYLKYFFL